MMLKKYTKKIIFLLFVCILSTMSVMPCALAADSTHSHVVIDSIYPNTTKECPGASVTFYDPTLAETIVTRGEPYEEYVSSRYVYLHSSVDTSKWAEGPYNQIMMGNVALGQTLTLSKDISDSIAYELKGSVDINILEAITAGLDVNLGENFSRTISKGTVFEGPQPPNSTRIWRFGLVYFERTCTLQRYNTYDMYNGSTYIGRKEIGAGTVEATVREPYWITYAEDY